MASWEETFETSLERLRSGHLLRQRVVTPRNANRDGPESINFASNDYLGLTRDASVIQAAVEAACEQGWGAGASPLVTGFSDLHEQLERRVAAFEKTPAAVAFSSGYATNTGVIRSLIGPGDCVFSDRLNHASIIDGCRLSGARLRVYPHGDMSRLRALLERHRSGGKALIVTESLFSMDGDVAPVEALVDLSEQYDALLYLDEAHASGVFGRHGRGVAEEKNVEQRIPVRVGTFSKAFGSIGGFVVGSQACCQWIVNRARPYIYSTALPPACCAASIAAIEMVERSSVAELVETGNQEASERKPALGEVLLERAADFRYALKQARLDIGNSESQIIPILVRTPGKAMEFSRRLREAGWLVPAIRSPSVPEGTDRLRISMTLLHDTELLERFSVDLADTARSLSLLD